MSSWRSGIAEVLWIDTALADCTKAVVEVFECGEVHLVCVCIVDIERTGIAWIRERGVCDLAGHLRREQRRGSVLKLCNGMLCYRDAVDYY